MIQISSPALVYSKVSTVLLHYMWIFEPILMVFVSKFPSEVDFGHGTPYNYWDTVHCRAFRVLVAIHTYWIIH